VSEKYAGTAAVKKEAPAAAGASDEAVSASRMNGMNESGSPGETMPESGPGAAMPARGTDAAESARESSEAAPEPERYSRQVRFAPIGRAGQEKLGNSRVLIVGMGALGSAIAQHLARAGVGRIAFVDRDVVELSNLQRQQLCDEEDARQMLPKAEAAARKLARINSEIELAPLVGDVTPRNAEALLAGVDLVLDGTDNIATRLLISDVCFKRGVPFVYGGAIASRGMSAVFVPGRTCCLRCLIGRPEATGESCETVGVLGMTADVTASLQAVEALKWLSGNRDAVQGTMITFDLWDRRFRELPLPPPDPACPVCSRRRFPALEEDAEDAVVLCGRNMVQVRTEGTFDLDVWAERLAPFARIERNAFLLRASLAEGETLVLFPDGRVLVRGTGDPGRARSLVARYIGA